MSLFSISNVASYVDRLERQLSGQQITAYDGTVYKRRTFQSDFHQKLDFELQDPTKATRIANSYRKHLQTQLLPTEQIAFEAWIIENARLIGAIPFFSMYREMPSLQIQELLKKHQHALGSFFREIESGEPSSYTPGRVGLNRPLQIVQVTTTGGGGHKSVADAITEIANESPDLYHNEVVDFTEFARDSDAILLTSGLLAVKDIYDRVFQQEREVALANRLWALNIKLRAFIPDTTVADLKAHIRFLRPDLIISTCHLKARDLSVASSLGVPIRFVHCDYEVSPALLPFVPKVNAQVVKFWLPDRDPELVAPVFTDLQPKIIEKDPSITPLAVANSLKDRVSRVFEYSGYPICKYFKRDTNAAYHSKIREKYGVKADEQVVVIQMGKQGIGDVFNAVKVLNEDTETIYAQPLHVAVFCGTNTSMQQRLLDYLASSRQHPQIHFNICPLMNRQETAEYMKIADVEFIKTGGATVAEVIAMRVKTLMYFESSPKWESGNRDWILRHGLGELVSDMGSLPKQLKLKLQDREVYPYEIIDARVKVPELIERAVFDFQVFEREMEYEGISSDSFGVKVMSPEMFRRVIDSFAVSIEQTVAAG